MSDPTGKPCILMCEDEMYVAMMLQDRLEHEGYRVLMAARVDKGRQLAESEDIDMALLDVNLDGEDSYLIAEALRARGIPFLFASGYDDTSLPEEWSHVKLLQKPFDTGKLMEALAQLAAS